MRMMSKKTSMRRRLGVASLAAATVVTGLGFGATPAMAEEPADGQRVTAKAVFDSYPITPRFRGLNPGWVDAYSSGWDTREEAGKNAPTVSFTKGGTGTISDTDGENCLTLIPSTKRVFANPCDGSAEQLQQWPLFELRPT
jgi:hypothetical protein